MLRNIEITRLLRYNRAKMKELFEAEVWLRQMARLRNFVRKNSPRGFRAVLFRMVPKQFAWLYRKLDSFRAVLFRMVPKHLIEEHAQQYSFRAVLFRMVPKQTTVTTCTKACFRAVLFRMVPKRINRIIWIS